jgi:xylan 1,4-beta-xylosidase
VLLRASQPPFFAVATVLAALAVGPSARAQTAVDIAVDATTGGTPLERIWPFYGYDEVNYTTTAAGKALLKELAKMHVSPVHVRTHFLLNTGDGTPALKWGSTNVYTEDAGGSPVYSWTLMDGIMDAITQAGAFPLAEIAFMPHDLSTRPDPYKNSDTYALDGGCFYPPKDYAKWGALITAWANHTKGRYPDAETSWQWELWNEPDIGYWHGTFADYAKLFDYTEASLHGSMPNASLGGPAVASAGSAFLKQFLQHCATGTNAVTGKVGTRLDMISFHAKGGVAITGGHVQMNLGNQLRLHRDGMTAVAAVPQLKSVPIVVTEADPDGCAACPASQVPADAYRNSPAYGAYEVAMMKRTLELEARLGVKVRGLVTWAFLFDGGGYFPGYRALQASGIDLPVLNAFKLLGSLDGDRLPLTSSGARTLDDILTSSVRQVADVDAMATRNGRSIQVLVWSYHDDLVARAASPVRLRVKVPPEFGSTVTLAHLRADETHGDAYTTWVAQGKPAMPTPAQIQELQNAMQPVALEPMHTVDVNAGSVAFDFDLPLFGVSLVTLTPPALLDASAPDAAAQGDVAGAPDDDASPGVVNISADDANSVAGNDAANVSAGGAPVASGADSGCSCRLSTRPIAASHAWSIAAATALVLRRRRSGSQRPSRRRLSIDCLTHSS